MALLTNRKFVHFNRLENFKTQLQANTIAQEQIVFIKDARQIWTHGLFYCYDERITKDIYEKLLALNEVNVEIVSKVDDLQETIYNFLLSGATVERPSDMELGIAFFDTDLNKPIWWDGTKWIDCCGNPADSLHKGTTAQQPSAATVNVGFVYYNTETGKLQMSNGIAWMTINNTSMGWANIDASGSVTYTAMDSDAWVNFS